MAGKGGVGRFLKFLFSGEKEKPKTRKPDKKTSVVDTRPPQAADVVYPQPKGGAFIRGGPRMSASQREAIRNRMLEGLGEEGLSALEELLAAPRDLEIKCRHCGEKNIVKPPTSDNLRLQVVELLSKYAVGTRHEEEVTERYVLVLEDNLGDYPEGEVR
jgi:DNA-directed RNA polymerase subunit RPC12/RpoP